MRSGKPITLSPQGAVWLIFAGFSVISLWLAGHVIESDVAEYHAYALQALTPPIFHQWHQIATFGNNPWMTHPQQTIQHAALRHSGY